MKKVSEKYHLDYFIIFLILCALEILLISCAILHPRIQNIMLLLLNGSFIFQNGKWMNKEKYVSPRDYDNEISAWKKRKKEAKEQGEIFEEPRPAKPRKIAQRLVPMFIAILFLWYIVFWGGSMLNVFFPMHMPYEYESDIAKLKENDYEAYYFFPDEIPKGAKKIKWYIMPSFMQGGGTKVLIFDTSNEYIQNVIDTYSYEARICGIEDDMSFRKFYNEARLEKLTVYKIYDNDDWNRVHMWGFFVDEEINRIGFFCE